jgi:hypothetical protein
MGLRWQIPLPGPFSVGGTVRGQRRTVWTHPGCYAKHPTEAAANAHAATLSARTPEQMRRGNRAGMIIGLTLAAGMASGIVVLFVHIMAFALQ